MPLDDLTTAEQLRELLSGTQAVAFSAIANKGVAICYLIPALKQPLDAFPCTVPGVHSDSKNVCARCFRAG